MALHFHVGEHIFSLPFGGGGGRISTVTNLAHRKHQNCERERGRPGCLPTRPSVATRTYSEICHNRSVYQAGRSSGKLSRVSWPKNQGIFSSAIRPTNHPVGPNRIALKRAAHQNCKCEPRIRASVSELAFAREYELKCSHSRQ